MSQNVDELREKVIDVIVEQLSVKREDVVPGASFVDSLGADSLDLVELIQGFEEAFDVEISDAQAEKATTVQEAFDLMEEILG